MTALPNRLPTPRALALPLALAAALASSDASAANVLPTPGWRSWFTM